MDPFALVEAMLERPARPHLVSALDVFDIARQALLEATGYDPSMRLEEQFQSADGCFTAFRIRDEAARGRLITTASASFWLRPSACRKPCSGKAWRLS